MTTKTITKEDFDALVKRVAAIESQMSSSEVKSSIKKNLSKREIFLQYSLESDVEKCLAIMSILDNENSKDGFDLKAIQESYKTVKEKTPGNPSDVIARLHKKGFVDVISGKHRNRMYSLTNTGLEALAELRKEEEK